MKKKNSWSEDEISYLKENYFTQSISNIARHLGKTTGAVYSQAGLCGLKKNGYSDEETRWLIDNYPTAEWDVLVKKLGRKKSSIIAKASELHLSRASTAHSRFTKEEDELIRTVWVNMDEKEFVNIYMPYRSVGSVQSRASKIGVCRSRFPWTEDEDALLKSLYKTMPISEMESKFDKHNKTSIYNRMIKLGLTDAPTFAYSDKDIGFIKTHYLTMTDSEIGAVLNRRAQSIKECRRKHGIYRLTSNRLLAYRDIEEFLHRNNHEWRKRAMEYDNYRCALTGERFDAVHHIYGNNLILSELFEKIHIPDDFDIKSSTEEEREYILNEYLKIENKYPIGICLSDAMHKKFHGEYGYGNNTPEQFYEFVKNVAPDKIDRLLA